MFGWFRPHIREQRRQVSAALVGYPPYEPPKWDVDQELMGEATIEYRQFFLAERSRRLEALGSFLGKFGVDPNLDDAGIMAVSVWYPAFADLLATGLEKDTVLAAYREFGSPWIGDLLGLNTIFDLGVYFGECMLLRNRRFEWKPIRGPERVSHNIFGQKSGRPFDPIDYMHTRCRNIQATKKPTIFSPTSGTEFIKPDALYKVIHGHLR